MTTSLRRAMLYIPSSSSKYLLKSLTLQGSVDSIAYDLEDSVTLSKKDSARTLLADFLASQQPQTHQPHTPPHVSKTEVAVRINAVETGLAIQDLEAILGRPEVHVDTIVVPKVDSAADLQFVTDAIRHLRPHHQQQQQQQALPSESKHGNRSTSNDKQIKILALIESARALTDLNSICTASPFLDGLIFAAEDFALDLSITRTPSLMEFLYARSAIVTAARAHKLTSTMDLVCTSFRGEDGLKALEIECEGGKGLGFNGKQCIHPSQVEVVQRTFAPSLQEVEWAVRVAMGDEKANQAGRGAWTLEGKMIDAPVSAKARVLVRKAEACGFDVGSVREKWKGQEPE